jgi:hypothetical protein
MPKQHPLNRSQPLRETNSNMTPRAYSSGPASTDKRPEMRHGIQNNPKKGGGINRSLMPARQGQR